MNQRLRELFFALSLALVLPGCSRAPAAPPAEARTKPALLPQPVVNHSPSDAQPGQKIEHGELILDVDEARRQLNAQHHSYKVLYALGDKLFVQEGPYVVNIPPGVPHSFQNLDDEVAELVVIFPTNVWEYDVLDHFPFNTPEARAMAEEARRSKAQAPGE
jgi:hypothetical protein